MTLRLNGSTSGYTEIDAPAVAGNNTLRLPTGNGSADQVIATNGSGALSFVDRGRMVLATAQASTSGTNIDFTGIPSWVKRVTVMFNGVSTSGASNIQVQIGAGSIDASGYLSSAVSVGAGTGNVNSTTGFVVTGILAATVISHGIVTLCNLGSNNWASGSTLGRSDTATSNIGGGSKTLSGTLTQLRITTVNGTDTFDAGSINILYEG